MLYFTVKSHEMCQYSFFTVGNCNQLCTLAFLQSVIIKIAFIFG